MSDFPQEGTADPAFADVAEAFRRNFASGAEVGAGVCVYHRGRPVVDVWGGFADEARTDPWRADTLAILASPTKALVAGAALLLVDRGLLDLDTPVAAYWPEFAAHGKAGITLRMVLGHRSGVVCLDHAPITEEHLRAHHPIAEALAAARPEWEPDTAHGYHATTFGHLVSELVRRRTGRTVGAFFAEEIAAPLGLDCHIGLKDPGAAHLATMLESKAEELMAGADPGDGMAMLVALGDPASLTHRAVLGSMSLDLLPDPVVENPSYDGLASARSLARFHASFIGEIDGFRLTTPRTTEQIRTVHSTGTCRTTLLPSTWGLGVMLPDGPMFPAASGLGGAFGLGGANGNFAFADPDHNLAFAYVQNAGTQVIGRIDDRARRLVEAAYRSIGVR
ncbi:serine hydrolase domain-containing protein [Streptomyces sp. ODS05-4]|uniref:serine hydrolase domain-containing protein n=1 Tax=Streptomyces sp. ODS05-4 TaxID=2944939 RepID=UPI00210ACF3C|nr:serine hydrolase domain-containing protein [Streptomyces sp. ODS05-4]